MIITNDGQWDFLLICAYVGFARVLFLLSFFIWWQWFADTVYITKRNSNSIFLKDSFLYLIIITQKIFQRYQTNINYWFAPFRKKDSFLNLIIITQKIFQKYQTNTNYWFAPFRHQPILDSMMTQFTDTYICYQGPLLLTWLNFNPTMDK